ncbi:unnamed protein product [marine sediment metagenome]|uniref:Uncharacterized protein n=1 Tax=marine sediment metagenome TaxID=412755 RepID=X1KNS1_9ZZZZ
MAHKYNNFNGAFNAFVGQWFKLDDQRDAIGWQVQLAQGSADSEDWRSAIYMLGTAIGNCAAMTVQIFDADAISWDNSFFNECLYWAAQEGGDAEPYELTATKICEAWAKKGFEDRALTIAFIDRMRQLIWDEPFFVAWAAKPEG